jgi:hypothetical protein
MANLMRAGARHPPKAVSDLFTKPRFHPPPSKDLRDLPVLVVHPGGQNPSPLIVRLPRAYSPRSECCPRHAHGA